MNWIYDRRKSRYGSIEQDKEAVRAIIQHWRNDLIMKYHNDIYILTCSDSDQRQNILDTTF